MCLFVPHRQHIPFPSWLSPLSATPRSCPSTPSSASESPLFQVRYLIPCLCRIWHSLNSHLSDFSPTKKRMQQVSNISILVMYTMYFLAALFGYLTFKGESSCPRHCFGVCVYGIVFVVIWSVWVLLMWVSLVYHSFKNMHSRLILLSGPLAEALA